MTIAWQDSLRLLDELEEQEARLLGWGVAEVEHTSQEVEDVVRTLIPDVSPSDGVAGLVGQGLLLQTSDGRYRTRTAEAVRLASSLRQWFGSGPYGRVTAGDVDPDNPSKRLADLGDLASWEGTKRLVSDFRFRSDRRRVPRRHRTREEVLRGLEARGGRDLTRFLEVLLPDTISQFQEDSLQTLAGWRGRRRDSAAIVTAGTGAGKTYAFYLPVLAALAAEAPPSDCPSVLAIYPRIELLKDQLRVAFELCRNLDRAVGKAGRAQLSVGALFADVPWDWEDVERKKVGRGGWKKSGNGHICPFLSCPKPGCGGDLLWRASDRKADVQRLECAKCDDLTEEGQIVLTRKRLESSPPDVLFISMEMLNRSLQKRGMSKVIGGRSATPRYVLLDEVHTYGGAHRSAKCLRPPSVAESGLPGGRAGRLGWSLGDAGAAGRLLPADGAHLFEHPHRPLGAGRGGDGGPGEEVQPHPQGQPLLAGGAPRRDDPVSNAPLPDVYGLPRREGAEQGVRA